MSRTKLCSDDRLLAILASGFIGESGNDDSGIGESGGGESKIDESRIHPSGITKSGPDDSPTNSLTTAEEIARTIQHIESCSHCQERIGELAASGQEWQAAKSSLVLSSEDTSILSEQSGRVWQSGMYHEERTEDLTLRTNVNRRNVLPNSSSTGHLASRAAEQLLDAPTHPEMLGRLGRFEIESTIGSGGMGVVFKGFDGELNRPVAIKVLAPHLADHGAARQRFAREAKAAAAIVHEHVVAIHNVESSGDLPYLVMQYVPGESLQQRIDRVGSLRVVEILRVAHQTASALAAAHAQGLIHRDVKPSNILLERGVDRALLADFGLARASDDATLTNTGLIAGTPHYMSPEQARGDDAREASDLFSLGSVIYTMCTGRPPFRSENSFGVLRKITDTEPRTIRELNSDIPAWLEAIVTKLHSKQSDDRGVSAARLAELLEGCLAHVQQPHEHDLPSEVERLVPQTSPPAESSRRAISLAIAGVLLGLFVCAGYWAVRNSRTGPGSSSTSEAGAERSGTQDSDETSSTDRDATVEDSDPSEVASGAWESLDIQIDQLTDETDAYLERIYDPYTDP